MLKRLDELGLITHVPYRGVRLTAAGRRIALEVIRHHRLLESYLAEVLGMPWDRVHDEAEVLEHVLSDDLEELIAAKLGNPTVDPHGDPIPTVEFDLEEAETLGLDELPIGAGGRFVRVSDSDPEMLRYLAEQGVALGESSRSSSASRSVGRCSCASATARSRSATRWRARCASSVGEPGVTPSPAARRCSRAPTARAVRSSRVARARSNSCSPRAGCGRRSRCSARRSSPSVAYVDPGNFATNFQGGAQFGFLLLWVVVLGEPDGDADPVPVGQARDRHRPQPARELPRALPPRASPGGCGCRPRSSRCRPTSPSSSAPRSR